MSAWSASWRRIAALVRREFLSIWQDKRGRIVLILPPLMQLVVFAYAATFDLANAPLGVLNEDMGIASRNLVARFTASGAFSPRLILTSGAEIAPAIESEKVLGVLRIGQTFTRDVLTGHAPEIQFIVDGRQSNTALIATSYVNGIVQGFTQELAAASGHAPSAPRLVTRAWFNPNLDSQWFIIPGLVASLTMIIATLTTSLSVARERELGTFEQLLVTPLRPFEILVGKILPPAILALGEGGLLAILGMVIFGIPFRGSLILLVVGQAVFLLSVTTVGLMVSTLTNTQQQAQIASFCVVMPCIILSGFTTPIDNMPHWVQVLTYANPLRYVLVINRGVFLQDIPLGVALDNLWPMAVIGLVTSAAAMRLFRSRLG